MTKIPQKPPRFQELLSDLHPQQLEKLISARRREDAYWHWDELRRRKPPEGLSVEDWWLQQKLMRVINRSSLPLTDVDGVAFSFTLPVSI